MEIVTQSNHQRGSQEKKLSPFMIDQRTSGFIQNLASRYSLIAGWSKTPSVVRTAACHTIPSSPEYTEVMRPKGHIWEDDRGFSRITISPTSEYFLLVVHFVRAHNMKKYSDLHCFQKDCVKAAKRWCWQAEPSERETKGSGAADKGLPIRKKDFF